MDSRATFAFSSATINCLSGLDHKCLPILLSGLFDSDIILVVHAAEALTDIGRQSDVLATLSPRISNEIDSRTSCLLARELIRAGDAQQIDVLTSFLEHSVQLTQLTAVESLFKIKQYGNETTLRRLLVESSNSHLHLLILAVLASVGHTDVFDQIRDYLENPSAKSRKIAVWILMHMEVASVMTQLQRMQSYEKDPLTRAYIDHALATFGDDTSIHFLKTNLSSNDLEIRRAAADAVRLLKSPIDLRQFEVQLESHDEDIRIRIAHAILKRNAQPFS